MQQIPRVLAQQAVPRSSYLQTAAPIIRVPASSTHAPLEGVKKTERAAFTYVQEGKLVAMDLKFDGDVTLLRANALTGRMETVPLLLQANKVSDPGETGLRVWDAGILLAKFIEGLAGRGWPAPAGQSISARQGRRVRALELGCGTGISGIAMALMGADVILTDQEVLRERAEKNMALNASAVQSGGGSCRFVTLDWKDLPASLDSKFGPEPFDFIITSDTIWIDILVEPFMDALRRCYPHGGGRPTVLVGQKARHEALESQFEAALLRDGFRFLARIPAEQVTTDERYINPACFVWELAA